jgi:hypothetical protein
MTNRLLAGCCAALLPAADAPALAEEAAATSATPSAEATPVKEKKVCKREKSASGTRVGTGRVCKTQAEWDKLRAKAKDKADKDRGDGA